MVSDHEDTEGQAGDSYRLQVVQGGIERSLDPWSVTVCREDAVCGRRGQIARPDGDGNSQWTPLTLQREPASEIRQEVGGISRCCCSFIPTEPQVAGVESAVRPYTLTDTGSWFSQRSNASPIKQWVQQPQILS